MNKKADIIKTYARYVSPGKVDIYTTFGLVLVPGRREGPYLHDCDGRRYINCHCNGGVFNLGHRNARVMRAVQRAMQTYDIGNHHLISGPRAALSRVLASTMPKGLNQVVYGVSGGEAVDLAIKLARGVTGRAEIISAVGGYHGHTGFALAAGDAKFRSKFGPMAPGFIQVPFDNPDAIAQAVTKHTAAVILETVPATMGIVVPAKDYFQKVRAICDDAGALLILDEVQTGFGRTGRLWGFQHFGVVPDIVVLGKGMSGGIYPITATVYRDTYADFFRRDPFVHISTFGGSEIGCCAALEVLAITKRKEFLARVARLGRFFTREIGVLARRYPTLGLSVRGIGLMMGLVFKDEGTALSAMKAIFDNGIYLVYAGNDPRVLQFLPVLTITEAQAKEIVAKLDAAFRHMTCA